MVEPAARGLHGQVVQRLGSLIASGEIGADEQIVPDQLGERFGVSRTVVREALRVLETKGMVAARPKTGTRVRPVEDWDLLDRDVILWRVNGPGRESQLRELLDLRSAVEPMAVRRCALHSAPADVRELRGICEDMGRAVAEEDWAGFTAADIAFHTALLAASGSRIFRQISGAIEAVLRAREALHLMPERLGQETVAAHVAIVTGIEAGNEDAAEAASRHVILVADQEVSQGLLARTGGGRRAGGRLGA